MTNRLLKLFLLAIISLLFVTCKNTESLDTKVGIETYLRYIATVKEMRVETSFFNKKDTALQAVSFDNVTLSNHIMKKRKLHTHQIRYQLDLDRHEPTNEYFLRFYDKGADPNEVVLKPTFVDSFRFENPIEKSEGATFTLYGNTMDETEKLTLIFTNEKNESAKIDIPQMPIGKPITIQSMALKSLPFGENEIYVVRSKMQPIQTEFANGKAIMEFYSKTSKIQIKE